MIALLELSTNTLGPKIPYAQNFQITSIVARPCIFVKTGCIQKIVLLNYLNIFCLVIFKNGGRAF